MSDPVSNTFKDLLVTGITKAKSTINELVSGARNLFRHGPGSPGHDRPENVNDHLKSPEEIEAEFKSFSSTQIENLEIPVDRSGTYRRMLNKAEGSSGIYGTEEPFPDYMEENY